MCISFSYDALQVSDVAVSLPVQSGRCSRGAQLPAQPLLWAGLGWFSSHSWALGRGSIWSTWERGFPEWSTGVINAAEEWTPRSLWLEQRCTDVSAQSGHSNEQIHRVCMDQIPLGCCDWNYTRLCRIWRNYSNLGQSALPAGDWHLSKSHRSRWKWEEKTEYHTWSLLMTHNT